MFGFNKLRKLITITDKPNTDVNTNDPAITKFHCVFNWKFCDVIVTYFSGVQGVDSDELISETDLSKIKVARIKTRFNDDEELKRAVYQSPYSWSQSLLLGNAEIHEVNISNDGEAIENINTIGVDTFLRTYEVLSNENSIALKEFTQTQIKSFNRNDGKNHQTNESVFLSWFWN